MSRTSSLATGVTSRIVNSLIVGSYTPRLAGTRGLEPASHRTGVPSLTRRSGATLYASHACSRNPNDVVGMTPFAARVRAPSA